jgi:hypothetical protein
MLGNKLPELQLLLISLLACSATAIVGERHSGARSAHFFQKVHNWEIVYPQRLDTNTFHTRRKLSGDGFAQHDPTAVYKLNAFNRTFVLDLARNDNMFHPDYKEVRVNADGTESVNVGAENCYYHGSVQNTSRSIVAVDTCEGLRGMIKVDGKRFQVLPASNHFDIPAPGTDSDPYIIYSQHDVDVENFVFGTAELSAEKKEWAGGADDVVVSPDLRRRLTSRSSVDGPVGAKQAHYVEWAIVNDDKMHDLFGMATESHTASMVNAVAATYSDANAQFSGHQVIVTLKEQLTFTTYAQLSNAIEVSPGESGTILSNFKNWRKENFGDNDAAAFLCGVDFSGGVLGLAYVGTMCGDDAVGVNQYRDDLTTITTMTHELGHNFYMQHDTGAVTTMRDRSTFAADVCPASCNVMASHQRLCGGVLVDEWSDCSRWYIQYFFDNSHNLGCLNNRVNLEAHCGNGLLEAGEQCDPGSLSNDCCDPVTCQRVGDAVCSAEEKCCTNACTFRPTTWTCRETFSADKCNPPETCTGDSGTCPEDIFKPVGTACGTSDNWKNSACDEAARCVDVVTLCDSIFSRLGWTVGSAGKCRKKAFATKDCVKLSCAGADGNRCYKVPYGAEFLNGVPCGGDESNPHMCRNGVCTENAPPVPTPGPPVAFVPSGADYPTPTPTTSPTLIPTMPTVAPTHQPTESPCADGAHDCDITSTQCVTSGTDENDENGYSCACLEGFVSGSNELSCVATPAPTTAPTDTPTVTEAPTSTPTLAPTHLPTEHPCEDNSHNCDRYTTQCETDGGGHDYVCACIEGFVENPEDEFGCVVTPSPTEAPTLYAVTDAPTDQPTLTPTDIPTSTPTHLPTMHACEDGSHDCDCTTQLCIIDAPGSDSWGCVCREGYVSDPYTVGNCIATPAPTAIPTTDPSLNPTLSPTPIPTEIPTLQPTHMPTYNPCDDGSHGCQQDSTTCSYLDPAGDVMDPEDRPNALGYFCACREGYVRGDTATACDLTAAPTPEPTRRPTEYPTDLPTAPGAACADVHCNSHGQCITPDADEMLHVHDDGSPVCQCDEGWRGAKCQFLLCPTTTSPLVGGSGHTDGALMNVGGEECSEHGYCVTPFTSKNSNGAPPLFAPPQCNCFSGFSGIACATGAPASTSSAEKQEWAADADASISIEVLIRPPGEMGGRSMLWPPPSFKLQPVVSTAPDAADQIQYPPLSWGLLGTPSAVPSGLLVRVVFDPDPLNIVPSGTYKIADPDTGEVTFEDLQFAGVHGQKYDLRFVATTAEGKTAVAGPFPVYMYACTEGSKPDPDDPESCLCIPGYGTADEEGVVDGDGEIIEARRRNRRLDGAGKCQLCAPGTYSDSDGYTPCVKCMADEDSLREGGTMDGLSLWTESEGSTKQSDCKPAGCTDPVAINFDAAVSVADGSCVFDETSAYYDDDKADNADEPQLKGTSDTASHRVHGFGRYDYYYELFDPKDGIDELASSKNPYYYENPVDISDGDVENVPSDDEWYVTRIGVIDAGSAHSLRPLTGHTVHNEQHLALTVQKDPRFGGNRDEATTAPDEALAAAEAKGEGT